jgi:restriction system protein
MSTPIKYTSAAPDDYIEQMTPTEFELTIRDYIGAIGKDLPDFVVAHDVRLVGSDGIYQIDVLAGYTALGVKMQVLIECKHYTYPVPREKVQILYDKMRATDAHKGILFSTAGFQDGAIEYALRHKIALIRMLAGRFEHVTNTIGKGKQQPVLPAATMIIGEYVCDKPFCFSKPGRLGELLEFLGER